MKPSKRNFLLLFFIFFSSILSYSFVHSFIRPFIRWLIHFFFIHFSSYRSFAHFPFEVTLITRYGSFSIYLSSVFFHRALVDEESSFSECQPLVEFLGDVQKSLGKHSLVRNQRKLGLSCLVHSSTGFSNYFLRPLIL